MTTASPATYWAQLLHFYQPPWQEHDVLRRIADESYRPLIRVLNAYEGARIAVNVNAVLSEMWLDHGMGDIVRGLGQLAERGQIEFVGSGRFHPILPLVTPALARRSISENRARNEASFGSHWQARGFFPPEMAIDRTTVQQAGETGHDWIAASGIACVDPWPVHDLLTVETESGPMTVLFRDDRRSNNISFRVATATEFVDDLSRWPDPAAPDAYVFTAMDAETFGHHIHGWEHEFLGAAYERLTEPGRTGRHVKMVQPGELAELFPLRPGSMPHASSWSTSAAEIHAGDAFPLWRSPGNILHRAQWELAETAVSLVELASAHADTEEARRYATRADEALQPALHSCQFWWASRRPMWEPELVFKGLGLLMHTIAEAMLSIFSSTTWVTSEAEAVGLAKKAADLRASIESMLVGPEAE
jgi:alpha-amylase/alpha-mannosidase (GH57 family)